MSTIGRAWYGSHAQVVLVAGGSAVREWPAVRRCRRCPWSGWAAGASGYPRTVPPGGADLRGGQQGSDRCCLRGACAGRRRPGNVIVPRYAPEPLLPVQLHIVPAAADLNQARPGTAGQQRPGRFSGLSGLRAPGPPAGPRRCGTPPRTLQAPVARTPARRC